MDKSNCETVVSVSQPERIGDGMNAFVRYTLETKTNNKKFSGTSFEVCRRFREFHALYETLVDIYRPKGIFIPHPPEKSVSASTRVKIDNKTVSEVSQIEQRRAALERYINRLTQHPILGSDDNVIGFLCSLVCTVKPRDRLIKLANNINMGFFKFLPDAEDYDQWFEDRLNRVSVLEMCLENLSSVGYECHSLRKELISSTKRFVNSASELIGTESNCSVSRALSSICDMKTRACEVYDKLCLNDMCEIIGTPKDYLDDLISVKHMFSLYTKYCSSLRSIESKLQNRKDLLLKLQEANKQDKIPATQNEIDELEKQVKFSTTQLEQYYEKMKSEINYFEGCRVKDMRASAIRHAKTWKSCQAELLELWENVLPICQSIQ